MKKLFFLAVSVFAVMQVFAQYANSTVTININDNRTRKVEIDGTTYTTGRNAYSNSDNAIVVSDLQPGQHTLKVVDNRRNDFDNNNKSIVFTTRRGYDVTINVNDRAITVNESVMLNANNGYAYHTAMPAADFDRLYYSIKNKRTNRATREALDQALNDPNNYFTSYQAKQLIQLVNSDNNRLKYAETVYAHITDPYNFSEVTALLNRQTSRDELTAYIDNAGGSLTSSGNYTARDYAPMSTSDFNALYNSVQSKWFPGEKMTQLRDIFSNSNNHLNTYQAKQLIQLVSDESNRLELAKAAYNNITDPADFSQMYDVLSTRAYRDDLAAYVRSRSNNDNNYNNGNNYNVNNYSNTYARAMSNADFNSLYSNIANQWFPGSKMSLLRDAFNSTNNYFTTQQAKRLIQLVSDESNRLELAKLSYRTITDREHFTDMYDVLNNQADINRLTDYVRTYR